MVLREENVAGEYFGHLLDLLVAMKNGYVNGVRVRMGRVHVRVYSTLIILCFQELAAHKS